MGLGSFASLPSVRHARGGAGWPARPTRYRVNISDKPTLSSAENTHYPKPKALPGECRRGASQPREAGTIVRFGSIVPVDPMLKNSPKGDRNYLRSALW